MRQILEWSDQEFKITVINISVTLMEKADNMKQQVGNRHKEMDTLRNNKRKHKTSKIYYNRNKEHHWGSSVDWTQPRKESLSLKIRQCKLPKLKCKEKKENKTSKDYGTILNGVSYMEPEYQKEMREWNLRNTWSNNSQETDKIKTPNHRSKNLREYQVG